MRGRLVSGAKAIGYAASALAHRALTNAGLSARRPPVGLVIERADWAIRWWGTFIAEEANRITPDIAWVTTDPAKLTSGVVEFGSQYQWLVWRKVLSPRCRMVTTFFHGKREDGQEVSDHIDQFLESVPQLERIVASAGIVRDRLISWGVPAKKIAHIPIGCETGRFVPATEAQRRVMRARFGIRDGEVVIGSFQKDGVGWGDGMEPKLIKGPDIFLAAIAELRKTVPAFVLLSGPARGYVKAGLERLGVRYAHHYAVDRDALAELFHALDLCFITSREEGGPMALMEAMSSGVPVVSTRVGMAPDLIEQGVTGALSNSEDVADFVTKAQQILALPDGAAAMKVAARKTVLVTDWSVVARRHIDEVWKPLLCDINR
jgi:glycosyltransferase involved in cell wall biosynthesis